MSRALFEALLLGVNYIYQIQKLKLLHNYLSELEIRFLVVKMKNILFITGTGTQAGLAGAYSDSTQDTSTW